MRHENVDINSWKACQEQFFSDQIYCINVKDLEAVDYVKTIESCNIF